jgi:hypothetical protein
MRLLKENLNNKNLNLIILSIILIITPYFLTRILGWIIIFYLIKRNLLIGLSLLAFFSFFFDNKLGTFSLFFTLKPFHIILLFSLFIFFWKEKNLLSLKNIWCKHNLFLFLFLAASFISSFYGEMKLKSLYQWFNVLFGIVALFMINIYIKDRKELLLVMNFFILGGIVKSFFFIPYLVKGDWEKLFLFHSGIALPLSFLIFFLITKYFITTRVIYEIMWQAIFALNFILIMASATRGFIWGLFLAIVVFFFFAFFNLKKYIKSVISVLLLSFYTIFTFTASPFLRDNLEGIWINMKMEYFKEAFISLVKKIDYFEASRIHKTNNIPIQSISFQKEDKEDKEDVSKKRINLSKNVESSLKKEKVIEEKEKDSVKSDLSSQHPFKTYQNKSWTKNPILWTLNRKRYFDWIEALETIKSNPLIGRGLRDKKIGSHNLYLEIFAATGIFGFIGFFGFIFSIFISNLICIKRYKEFFSLIFISGIIIYLASSFTSTYYVQHYIWIFFSIGVTLVNLYNKKFNER